MIRSKLCLAAESVVIDRESNATSFINLFEGMQAEGFPFVLPKLSYFVLWEREATDAAVYASNLTVKFGTEVIVNQAFEINFQNQPRSRSVLQMAGLVIPRPGIVTFDVNIPAQDVSAKYSFEISGAPPQAVATSA